MALTSPQMRTFYGQLTTAEVNAGKIVVRGAPGRIYTVVDGWARAIGGAAGAVTSVDVNDTAGSPATAIAYGQAGLTQNTVLRAGAANTTVTGLGTAFGKGNGIKVVKNGSDMTTATALDVCIHYTVASVQAA